MSSSKVTDYTEITAPATDDVMYIVDVSSSGDGQITAANLLRHQYGSCYGTEIGWTQAGAVQNTWYDISNSSMVDGELNGVTHDGSGKLTATKSGMYAADWAGSFEADAANKHVQITFSINGTEGVPGLIHFETVAISREQACSGNAILDLSANDTVNVSIRTTDAGTPDILVDHLLIRLVRIGDT
jgi:hypothetical protein